MSLSSCGQNHFFNNGVKGSGNITTESRNANEDYKSIEVSQGIQVVVEQTQIPSIRVEVDDNLQEHIITKIENGVLKVYADKSFNATEAPIVMVKTPVINGLKTTSGAEITSSNILITDKIEVKTTSGSEIKIEVEADFISMDSSSGSSIEVSGKALKATTSSSSGSEIDAKNLLANEVKSNSSSGSSTAVNPILLLEADASSGSSIHYYTIPKTLAKEASSGASIKEK